MKATPKPTDSKSIVQFLLNKLDFTPENCVEAACENSNLFIEAVKQRLDTLAERNAAKMAFEVAEAETGLQIRHHYRVLGEKVTEGNIDALVLMDAKITAARNRLNKAEEADELGQRLVEAFRMRRDCLQIVERVASEERRLASQAETNSKLTQTRQTLREKYKGE
jgi:hypothetical protein